MIISELVNFAERSRNVDMNFLQQNILVCEDANLKNYPIRTACHIVHYSLPNKLETFLHRFVTCFGYYAEKLDRELLNKTDRYELSQPISLVYFDDNFSEELIQIHEVIAQKTQSEIPSLLTDTIEVSNEHFFFLQQNFIYKNYFNFLFISSNSNLSLSNSNGTSHCAPN